MEAGKESQQGPDALGPPCFWNACVGLTPLLVLGIGVLQAFTESPSAPTL